MSGRQLDRNARWWQRPLPTLRFSGSVGLVAAWIGLGSPALFPGAGAATLAGPQGDVPLLFAAAQAPGPTPAMAPLQASFREVVEAARRAWSDQDPAGIVRTSRQLLLQLPGADTRASVGRDQAVRLVAGVLRRTEGVSVRVQTAREVGPGQGYAELVRQYRVSGTDEVRSQRILLAFREAPTGGDWELVELRVLQAGD